MILFHLRKRLLWVVQRGHLLTNDRIEEDHQHSNYTKEDKSAFEEAPFRQFLTWVKVKLTFSTLTTTENYHEKVQWNRWRYQVVFEENFTAFDWDLLNDM